MPPNMAFAEFAAKYCERQVQTPAGLLAIFRQQQAKYQPDGWMLLECVDMCSSRFGGLTILVYGPRNTYHEVPDRPISPRGLASDMSVVIGILRAEDLPLGSAS